jgi:vancomycin resistance protein YoaR
MMTLIIIALALAIFAFTLNLGVTISRYVFGVKPGVTLEGVPMERLLKHEVHSRVAKMADVLDRAPRNARFDRKNNVIVTELPGQAIDIQVTVEKVTSAPANTEVGLVMIRLDPEITAELFRSITKKVASFSTSGGGSAGRTDNLYVSAKYMNGMVLGPGDVFSFNKATGPRTFERGYSMAPVVGGMGIGGGVCQVATTIYNTALQAGLEIIERHPHSVTVGYVPPGRDATVTDYIDLKFRNSTNKYLQIRSGAGGGHVWVQLWSQ